jgi:TPR repeat protein
MPAALILFGLGCVVPAIAQYAPPDQRTVYDSWMRDIRSNRPSTRSPVPQTDQAAKFRAAQAQNRYNDQQQKMFAEQNARIARENERIRALNADYDRLAALGQRALAGSVDAMRQYGFELMNRADSSERTKETGRAWVQAASDHGDAVSKQWLRQQAAQLAQKREEAEKNARDAALAESIRTEIVKAKAGNVDSMCWLGMRYYFDGTPAQRQFSREWLEQAVAHNDKGTLLFLVDQTRNGIGTPEELARAIDYRRRLAELPNQSTVCLELGGIYLTGKFGVTPDRAIAAPYLEKAAAGGQLDAWFMLAEACDHAIAGPRDREAAIACYRAALAQPLKKYYSDKKNNAALALSLLLLDPASDPPVHAAELLKLWDKNVQVNTLAGEALCLLAADALASGQLGLEDRDRELLYLSRPLRYGSNWTDTQELADRALNFGAAVIERSADPAHPLYLLEQRKVRVTSSGYSDMETQYLKVVAKPQDALTPLLFAARNAPRPQVRAFLLAGSVAESLSKAALEETGFTEGLAFEIYEEAAAKFDDATGWLESGRLQLSGIGVKRDPLQAQTRLQKAWDKGEPRAALYLAIIQQQKLVRDTTAQRATEWIKLGAEKNDVDCMAHWGAFLVAAARDKVLDAASAKTKAVEAVSWLEKAAAAGSASAMAQLSNLYIEGFGVPQDDAKAIALLQQAADTGYGPAQRDLAERLATGRGVEKNQPLALKLLYAAAHTDLTAANNLGVVLWRGDWGDKDVADGLKWMEVTLDNGFWVSGRNLAKIYHLGLGVTSDEDKARNYLEKAGAAAGAESARGVAELYERGEVIAKDLDAAQRWRRKADTYPQGGG